MSEKKHVIVGMSGGVDSSVSAYLLIKSGYHVEGLFMKNWEEDDGTEYCTAKDDLTDATSVCNDLKIKLHVANFSAEYWDNVFEHFLTEYQSGRTPNPDILCNKEIKFKAFLEYALDLGADFIATGHYVRSKKIDGTSILLKGLDDEKDQSYFLSRVPEFCIDKSLFPIGALKKSEVRKIAKDHNFDTHDKKDSTGICFIGERKFKDFLSKYVLTKVGNIETTDGEIIGKHSGVMFYTIGQRQGLGIGGVKNYPENPWYVIDKDIKNNILIVAQGNEHTDLYSTRLIASQLFWVNEEQPKLPLHCSAKIRYRQTDQLCFVKGLDSGFIQVDFDKPQRAITPGQHVVFYTGEQCLGGAIIERASPELQ